MVRGGLRNQEAMEPDLWPARGPLDVLWGPGGEAPGRSFVSLSRRHLARELRAQAHVGGTWSCSSEHAASLSFHSRRDSAPCLSHVLPGLLPGPLGAQPGVLAEGPRRGPRKPAMAAGRTRWAGAPSTAFTPSRDAWIPQLRLCVTPQGICFQGWSPCLWSLMPLLGREGLVMDSRVASRAACWAQRETNLPHATQRQLVCFGVKEGGAGDEPPICLRVNRKVLWPWLGSRSLWGRGLGEAGDSGCQQGS